MRYFALVVVACLFCTGSVSGQRRKPKVYWPKTEGEMMHKLLGTLQQKDTAAYFNLFPTFDTLWSMVMHNSDKSPETEKALAYLREHPQVLIEFDPRYNHNIINNYANVLAKGEDSGMNWPNALMARYELVKSAPTRSLIGYDRVSPERFQGYMFVNDGYNRVTFCIKVAEVQKIKNNFFGGQVLNILRAATIDEYLTKEAMEQDYYAWLAAHPDTILTDTTVAREDTSALTEDTSAANDPLKLSAMEDEEKANLRKEVIERRYYEGKLDNEIPIVLYIRYMKVTPGKPQLFDGLYKLGENKRYLRTEIVKTADGKWIIEDEGAVGVMELHLNGRTFTGIWSNADDNGYDVALSQTGAPAAKIEMLDKIIDEGLSGKLDESKYDAEKEKAEEIKLEKEKEEQKKEEEKKRRREEEKKEKKEKKAAEKKERAEAKRKQKEERNKGGENDRKDGDDAASRKNGSNKDSDDKKDDKDE